MQPQAQAGYEVATEVEYSLPMTTGFVNLCGGARLIGSGGSGGGVRCFRGARATCTMALPPVTFVTGNANKLREVRLFLSTSGPLPMELISAPLDLPELQGTIEEIATAKCAQAAALVDGPVLVEDTALVRCIPPSSRSLPLSFMAEKPT